jgi:hypothetical protein
VIIGTDLGVWYTKILMMNLLIGFRDIMVWVM